jgi:hypothetical protein
MFRDVRKVFKATYASLSMVWNSGLRPVAVSSSYSTAYDLIALASII